jgi:hypothetical protein
VKNGLKRSSNTFQTWTIGESGHIFQGYSGDALKKNIWQQYESASTFWMKRIPTKLSKSATEELGQGGFVSQFHKKWRIEFTFLTKKDGRKGVKFILIV